MNKWTLIIGVSALSCVAAIAWSLRGPAESQAPPAEVKAATEAIELVVPERDVLKRSLELVPALGQWHLDGEPYSGYAVTHHQDGTLFERIGFYGGKKQGLAEQSYPSGAPRRRATHHRNRLHGVVLFWSEGGELRSETHYVHGAMHGTQRTWYPGGAPFKNRNLVRGREQGLQQAWRRNGKLYVNYEARDGRVFGLKRSTLCYQLEDEVVQN